MREGVELVGRRRVALTARPVRRRRHRQRRHPRGGDQRRPGRGRRRRRRVARAPPPRRKALSAHRRGHRRLRHPGRPGGARLRSSPPRPTRWPSSCSSPSTPPPTSTGEATITVSAEADGTTYVDSAFVTLESGARRRPQVVDHGKALVSKPVMLLGAGALFLGLVGLLATVLTSASGRSAAERRLDAYFDGGQRAARAGRRRAAKSGSTDLKESAVAMTSKVVNEDLETRISQRLAGAGSALTASEWVLLHAGHRGRVRPSSASSWAGPPWPCSACCSGVVLPWLYLKWRHRRRLNAFNGQLAADARPDGRRPPGRPVAAAGRGQRGPRGARADGRRAAARPGRAAARHRHLRRPRGRRAADGERGLRLGRHGHPHPARGRWQPGRDPAHRGGHPARARVPAPPGARHSAPRVGSPATS